jgi:hypothetical protein
MFLQAFPVYVKIPPKNLIWIICQAYN